MHGKHVTYEGLQREVRLLQLPERTPVHFALVFLFMAACLSFSFFILFTLDAFWWQLANGLLAGFATVQLGFFAHDLSHGQIFHKKHRNRTLACVIWPFFGALSESAWYEKHNAHHQYVNHEGNDPDLNIPFLFSYVQSRAKEHPLQPYIQPYQHVLFFVLLPFSYLNFVKWTFKRFFGSWDKMIALEFALVSLHIFIWFIVPFLLISASAATAFVLARLLTIGLYMGIAFAPNHKGEAVVTDAGAATWIHQIELTRNLFPTKLRFFIFGGLNYQIEHHLFPSMSRFNYPRIQPIIKSFCREHGIHYHETSWADSMKEIYTALQKNRKEKPSLVARPELRS